MTKLLELALTKVAELPDAEQDRIAQLVLDEIEDEARWQATFAGSQDKLAELAQRARREIARGEIARGEIARGEIARGEKKVPGTFPPPIPR